MDNSIQILKRLVVVLILSCSALVSFGEGSKNLYPSGATLNRASLLSTTGDIAVNTQVGIRFPNPGRHFVYAKVGEVIHVGSSAQGVVGTGSTTQTGTINLTAPNGTTYSSGTSTTTGRITNRAQELVGPTLDGGVDGGYTAYTVTVGSGEEGIWVVDFVGTSNAVVNGTDALNASSLTANSSWTMSNQQTNSRYIVAWDATVVSSGTRLTGRVYQTVFSADLGVAANQFCPQGKFIVLSKDGYQYSVEPQTGFQPFQFAFFANNKGLRFNTGSNIGVSAYRSAPNASVENASSNASLAYDYHTPNSADDASNITHKIFYNTPDATNLPATANIASSIYGTSTTWLYTSVPVVPTLTDLSLVGKEGTSGKFSTTAPLTGGFIKFNSNLAGSYRILIDANNDGDYTDNVDLTIRGDAVSGANSVAWDGKDGQGNFVANNANIKINAVTLAGEVHFPLADAEKNVNGIKFTRTNGTGAPAYTIYWDDNLLTNAGTSIASTPTTNLDNGPGQSSETNGHKWGLNAGVAGTAAEQFGNEAVIDTWMNVFSTEQNLTVAINYQEANLEIVSLTGNLTNICVGTEVTYTFVAKNNGPNNSGDATVSFVFPSELTNLSLVSATVTTGTATGVGGTFSGTTFSDVLSMDNGAIVTYVVKGTISSYPSGGNLNTSARILRAADVTDPDATNDDTSPPTDPVTECNGSPSGTGCNNIKDLTTTVQAIPSTANAGSNQSKCNDGNFTMAATTPAVGSGAWSVVSGTATITNTTLTNTTVTGVPAGTTATLRWTVSNGTCTSTTADITLTNHASPSIANAGSNQTKCNDGSFTLAATTPTVGTGAWSVVSGTATITNTTLTNTTVTGVPVGTTVTLRWTVSNGTCSATTADITLTNNNGPSAATITTAATLTNCNNGTFNIGAVNPALGTGQWSLISGTATITNVNVTSTTATGIPAGTSAVLRWTVSSAGCTSNITDVTLTNNASPSVANAGSNQTKCNDGNFTLTATTPTVGTGTWSVISGTATITNVNLTNTTVTGVSAGSTVTLRWTVSNGSCTATTSDITLTNQQAPSTANAGSNQSKCNDGNFTLAATTPTVGTGVWSIVSGTATITTSTLTNTTVTGVPVGTTATLRWTVSNGTCTATTADITLTNSASPSAANAGSNQTQCNNSSFTMAALTPTVGTGIWSVISGTATITNVNLTNTTVTGVSAGSTVTLRWTVSNGTCTATTSDITLTNQQAPSTANAGSNQSKCNDGNFTLAATTPTVGTGVWSIVSGTATITNVNLTNTGVTGVPVGTTATLRWTVSNGTCSSSTADITLTNNVTPSIANAGSNIVQCNNSNFTLAATMPTVGTGTWTVISGTATINNINLTNTIVTGIAAGSNATLRWTVSASGCTSNSADIVLSNQNSPSVANAGSNQTKCNDGVFTMAATTPSVGTGVWSIVSGSATIMSTTLTNTSVSGIPLGSSTTLRWTVTNSNCPSSLSDVVLTNAVSINAGSDITISCSTSTKLSAASSGQNWTVVSGNPSPASINNSGEVTGMIKKGNYFFTLSNSNCSVTVKVTKANCPPVALNDTQTVRNDQLLTGNLSTKASDADGDVITFSVLVPPARGTIVFNTDGSYVYTPPAGYIGTDSITYRVCDVDGLCADAKLYIQVIGPPLPPIAVNDSAKTNKNQPVSGNLLGNDHHSGTNSNTGLILNTNSVSGPSNGSVILNSDGSFTYTPANNFVGLDSFLYVICNTVSLCDTATVYIRVNEPPLLQPRLAIEKRVNPAKSKYGTGEIVTYTLVAKNTGNIIANDISVQDILPSASKIKNVRMVQGTPNTGLASYEPITNIIFWTIPFLHIGDSAILKYTMVLADSGRLVNTATISSLMINGIADTATVSIDVLNQADIKISKLLRAPAIISVNDEIGFTMITENFGPAVGTEVVIQDSLYANLSDPRAMSVNIGKVSFDPITRKITWRIDTLLVGQKDSLVIRVKIISGGEIRNGATVKAKQVDPVSGNNGAVVSNITGGQVLVEGRKFFIPSVITPNGDGKNDKFTILGINQFPGSELIIYNRWGNVVFQSKDYKNDWDGKGLNEGTYYYTLNLKTTSGSQRMAGWVEILR